jgi:hypothetical protein
MHQATRERRGRAPSGGSSAGWSAATLLLGAVLAAAPCTGDPGEVTTIAGGPGYGPARELAIEPFGVAATNDAVYDPRSC